MTLLITASELPSYTGGQAVTGTAVLLGLVLLLAVTLTVAWWHRR